jgi:uncharacterized protein (TIGR02271 family)
MSFRNVQISHGANVDATDGRLGTVEEVLYHPDTQDVSYLAIRQEWQDEPIVIPIGLVRSIPHERAVELGVTRAEAQASAAQIGQTSQSVAGHRDPGDGRDREMGVIEADDQIVVPIVEERLVPEKREVDLGEVRLHKHVETQEESFQVPVTRDDVVIQRVEFNQPIEEPALVRQEGDWLVVPVMKEVLVVQKQLMLVEEVRVQRRQLTQQREVREVTRHERVDVEDATARGARASGDVSPDVTERDATAAGVAERP